MKLPSLGRGVPSREIAEALEIRKRHKVFRDRLMQVRAGLNGTKQKRVSQVGTRLTQEVQERF